MAELANCSRCGSVFVSTVRDVCQPCYKAEEKAYQTVYAFLSERQNREATMKEIARTTGVEENLIIKFIKEKRLRPSEFPKLAYPCERCGVDIVNGRLCFNCSNDIKKGVAAYDRHKAQNPEEKVTTNVYYSFENRNKN